MLKDWHSINLKLSNADTSFFHKTYKKGDTVKVRIIYIGYSKDAFINEILALEDINKVSKITAPAATFIDRNGKGWETTLANHLKTVKTDEAVLLCNAAPTLEGSLQMDSLLLASYARQVVHIDDLTVEDGNKSEQMTVTGNLHDLFTRSCHVYIQYNDTIKHTPFFAQCNSQKTQLVRFTTWSAFIAHFKTLGVMEAHSGMIRW